MLQLALLCVQLLMVKHPDPLSVRGRTGVPARLPPRRCVLRCRTSPRLRPDRRRGPGHVEHEKRHFSHSCKTGAARMAVKGAPLLRAAQRGFNPAVALRRS
jgi:hypothetical protein